MNSVLPIDGSQVAKKLYEVLFLDGFVKHHDCLDADVGRNGGDHCDVS